MLEQHDFTTLSNTFIQEHQDHFENENAEFHCDSDIIEFEILIKHMLLDFYQEIRITSPTPAFFYRCRLNEQGIHIKTKSHEKDIELIIDIIHKKITLNGHIVTNDKEKKWIHHLFKKIISETDSIDTGIVFIEKKHE